MYQVIENVICPLLVTASFFFSIYNLGIVNLKFKQYWLSSIPYFIIILICYINNSSLAVPLTALLMLLYLLYKRVQTSQILLLLFLANLVLAFSDAISAVTTSFILRINVTELKLNPCYFVLLHIVIFIISYVISYYCGRLLKRFGLYSGAIRPKSKTTLWIIIYLGVSLAIIYLYSMLYRFVYSSSVMLVWLNLFLVIIYLMSSIIIVYANNKNVKKQLELQFELKEAKALKEYTSIIEEMSQDLRKFRHDYTNILMSIDSYVQEKDLEGLNEFLKKDLLPQNNYLNENKSHFANLQNIKLTGVKGLVFSKLLSAQNLNIAVHIDIEKPIEDINMNYLDLCRILGILLDNAMEGAVLCEEKELQFGIIHLEDCTSFVISNSCLTNTPPVHLLFEKNFSTKGEGRGLGLSIVKEIINSKYSDYINLNTYIMNKKFTQELVIFKAKRR